MLCIDCKAIPTSESTAMQKIRSYLGNIALATVGVLYVVAAVGLLAYYVLEAWSASQFVDHLLQLLLLVAAIAGVYFVAIAAPRLRVRNVQR